MLHQRLEHFLGARRCTLLGVGPMSLNCVDATIELANDYSIPIMLIASRRQIDSAEFGGGYVNGWTTQEFADYVISRDRRGKIILARDHGGPWQNPVEKDQQMSLRLAMESAKHSYQADIDVGFQIIHIDTSVDIHGPLQLDEALERAYELYDFCWSYAQGHHRDIIFEVGTEEQSGSTNTQEELEYVLNHMERFCKRNQLPNPSFVVVQTGTRVMETRNVGSFDSPVRVANEIPAEIQLPKMIDICKQHGVFMKEHNTDYLSDDTLAWHPRFGIHAANVAPEFGVTETQALIYILRKYSMDHLADEFLARAEASKKWEKWMLPNTTASQWDRAIIAGHYIFSDEQVADIKVQANKVLMQHGIDLDTFLKEKVKESILRYLKLFRLVNL